MVVFLKMLLLFSFVGTHALQYHPDEFVKFIPGDSGAVCENCKKFIGAIHVLLSSNDTLTEVLKALEDGCEHLPASLKYECDTMVITYGKKLLHVLDEFLVHPATVCAQIGFCNATVAQSDQLYLKKALQGVFRQSRKHLPANLQGTSDCALCEIILVFIQGIFEDNPTQLYIKETIEELCQLLPTPEDVTECEQVLNLLEPKAYQYIVKTYLDPMKFCPGMGIC